MQYVISDLIAILLTAVPGPAQPKYKPSLPMEPLNWMPGCPNATNPGMGGY